MRAANAVTPPAKRFISPRRLGGATWIPGSLCAPCVCGHADSSSLRPGLFGGFGAPLQIDGELFQREPRDVICQVPREFPSVGGLLTQTVDTFLHGQTTDGR